MDKEYSNEMRGALWFIPESDLKNRGPIAHGTVTISGVKLNITMWPKRSVGNSDSKSYGMNYMPISFEYPKGTTKFLAGVLPANVTVTSSEARAEAAVSRKNNVRNGDDIPF